MEIGKAPRLFLEEFEDRRGRVRAHGEQCFIDQRETQFGGHRLADLIGHGDFNLAVLTGQKSLLERLHHHFQLPLHGEILPGGAKLAAIDGSRSQAEIRKQVMADLERNVVKVRMQFDDLIAQDGFAFVGEQGQPLGQPRVQSYLGLLADLERGGVGKQPELVRIAAV